MTIIPVSVCGVIAKQGWEPYAWETAFYWQELTDPTAMVAVEFARQQIRNDGIGNGNVLCELFAARVHPGHIERCPGLDFADPFPEIREGDEIARHPVKQVWTVCGFSLETGATYSEPWREHGPTMAYFAAWEHFLDRGETFLLAAVHPGEPPRDEQLDFPYADTTCRTEEEMRAVLSEWR